MNQQELAKQATSDKQAMIRKYLPANYILGTEIDIRGYPDGREVFTYKGVPFLELLPPEFSSAMDGDRYVVKISQKCRRLMEGK